MAITDTDEIPGSDSNDTSIHRNLDALLTAGSLPFWGIVIYYAYTQMMPRAKYGVVFLGGILLLYLVQELADPLAESDYLEVAILGACGAVTIVTTLYLYLNFTVLYQVRVGHATSNEILLSALFTLVMIYLTWRSFGKTFLVVVLVGIGYGLFGPYLSGPLAHGGLSPSRTLRILVVSVDGFYGFLTQLVAAWIALFLLYAGLLKGYGAFDLIFRLALRSAKYIDSGIAQTAVIASAVIGSVNGSQTANAGMTGSFTIPLMKENGVEPETAGGIESVASTAGQVLPPVMGAGAFVMASLVTGITYVDVIVSGLIPAAILTISIFVAVHYVAAPQIQSPRLDDIIEAPLTRTELALESIKYGLPMAVLIYLLGIVQWTVMTAALYTTVAMLVTGTLIPIVRATAVDEGVTVGERASEVFWQTIDGAREGVVVLAPVAIILAAINGVVEILMATGVPTAISLTLMDVSGGVMIVAVVMAMVICILLGLGMPTTAAYTVVALLVAPTLTNQFLIPEVASHFFVFYAAILAGLTPPIATCVAVATGIAGGNFWRTCLESIKISAPLFVLPFVFVYNPEVVSGEFTTATLLSGAIALAGAIAIIHGINYWFAFDRTLTLGLRVAFFGLGLIAMVHPADFVRIGSLAGVVTLYAVQVAIGKPAPLRVLRGLGGGTEEAPTDPDRDRAR